MFQYKEADDPNEMSNLDRFIEAIAPKVSHSQLKKMTVLDLFDCYKEASICGLQIEMINELDQQP